MNNIPNCPNAVSLPEPTMCIQCLSFFANPQFKGLCSGCFKTQPIAALEKETLIPDLVAGVQNPAVAKAPAADPNTCQFCAKPTGIFGFKCKCEASFCKKHRLPENHDCNFDFAAEGKKILAKNNPVVVKDKVERID